MGARDKSRSSVRFCSFFASYKQPHSYISANVVLIGAWQFVVVVHVIVAVERLIGYTKFDSKTLSIA